MRWATEQNKKSKKAGRVSSSIVRGALFGRAGERASLSLLLLLCAGNSDWSLGLVLTRSGAYLCSRVACLPTYVAGSDSDVREGREARGRGARGCIKTPWTPARERSCCVRRVRACVGGSEGKPQCYVCGMRDT